MIAGRAPFVVDSRAESTEERAESLRRLHQTEEPRPLRELVPHVPADLDALVSGLLAKPQEQRPDSATIREVLEQYRRRGCS